MIRFLQRRVWAKLGRGGQGKEIARILEGRDQARAGQLSPIEDVIARFKLKKMLPADYNVETGEIDDPVSK